MNNYSLKQLKNDPELNIAIIKEGWLCKRGPSYGWQERYVVLYRTRSNDRVFVSYFQNGPKRVEESPKGTFEVKKNSEVKKVLDVTYEMNPLSRLSNVGKSNVFSIKTPQRTWFFHPSQNQGQDVVESWLKAIKDCFQDHEMEADAPPPPQLHRSTRSSHSSRRQKSTRTSHRSSKRQPPPLLFNVFNAQLHGSACEEMRSLYWDVERITTQLNAAERPPLDLLAARKALLERMDYCKATILSEMARGTYDSSAAQRHAEALGLYEKVQETLRFESHGRACELMKKLYAEVEEVSGQLNGLKPPYPPDLVTKRRKLLERMAGAKATIEFEMSRGTHDSSVAARHKQAIDLYESVKNRGYLQMKGIVSVLPRAETKEEAAFVEKLQRMATFEVLFDGEKREVLRGKLAFTSPVHENGELVLNKDGVPKTVGDDLSEDLSNKLSVWVADEAKRRQLQHEILQAVNTRQHGEACASIERLYRENVNAWIVENRASGITAAQAWSIAMYTTSLYMEMNALGRHADFSRKERAYNFVSSHYHSSQDVTKQFKLKSEEKEKLQRHVNYLTRVVAALERPMPPTSTAHHPMASIAHERRHRHDELAERLRLACVELEPLSEVYERRVAFDDAEKELRKAKYNYSQQKVSEHELNVMTRRCDAFKQQFEHACQVKLGHSSSSFDVKAYKKAKMRKDTLSSMMLSLLWEEPWLPTPEQLHSSLHTILQEWRQLLSKAQHELTNVSNEIEGLLQEEKEILALLGQYSKQFVEVGERNTTADTATIVRLANIGISNVTKLKPVNTIANTVYRGLNTTFMLPSDLERHARLKAGDRYDEYGFMSTGIKPLDHFTGGIQLVINVTNPMPAIDVMRLSAYPAESEVLFATKAQLH